MDHFETEREEEISFEAPEGDLEDVQARVVYDVEVSEREPYSWGDGRGKELLVLAKIVEIVLGDGLVIDRAGLVKWIGEHEVRRIEVFLADDFDAADEYYEIGGKL